MAEFGKLLWFHYSMGFLHRIRPVETLTVFSFEAVLITDRFPKRDPYVWDPQMNRERQRGEKYIIFKGCIQYGRKG
jgi:hypothetical protein